MSGLGRRASFLATMTVLAVALMGSAYTLWYEDLALEAEVTTDELDASLICTPPGDNESEQWPTDGLKFVTYPHPEPIKDIGDVNITPDEDQYLVVVEVEGAYPGYAWDCELEMFNEAGVPWHVETQEYTVQQCDSNGANCVELEGWDTDCDMLGSVGECTWGDLGINPPDYPDGLDDWAPMYIETENWLGCQVHEPSSLQGSFFMGFNQSLQEDTTYQIVLSFQVNQWNESKWDGCFDEREGADGPVLPASP